MREPIAHAAARAPAPIHRCFLIVTLNALVRYFLIVPLKALVQALRAWQKLSRCCVVEVSDVDPRRVGNAIHTTCSRMLEATIRPHLRQQYNRTVRTR